MPEETHKNTEIRKYLLGSLTTREDRQKIEERLLLNDEYFQALTTEEEELIQEYADGHLTDEERSNFERHFLVSEERQKKVKFAQAVRRYVDEQKKPEKITADEKDTGRTSLYSLKHFFSSPLAITLAALVIVAFSALIVWHLTANSSGYNESLALLNKAYEKERPFEARISGFEHAPASNLRGGNKTAVDQTALDLAENLALTSARKSPTAENLHNLGRLYLVKKDFDKAIEQLEKSEKLAPQNASIASDLGTAYLEKSKTPAVDDGKVFDLASTALESLEKALKLNPNLPEARFNKAICLQILHAPRQAQEAWQEYLKLDADSPWAEEARRNLQTLDLNKSQNKTKDELLRDFLAFYEQSDHEKAWQTFSRNREMITGKLIPQQLAGLFLEAAEETQKKEYLTALKYLGQLEKEKSGDSYFLDVADFYAAVPGAKLSDLREAQAAVKKGYVLCLRSEEKEAIVEFTRARELFENAGDVLEAKLTEYWIAYCDYQLNRIKESTEKFESLAAFLQTKNYKWLASNSFSRLAINSGSTGNYSKAIEYNKKSLDLSEDTKDLYLNQKILSQLSDKYQQLGQYDEALGYVQKSFHSFAYSETGIRQKCRTYMSAVDLLTVKKSYAAAAALAQESLALNAEGTRDETFAYTNYLQLSRIYGAQREFDKAMEYADRSLKSAEKLPGEQVQNKSKAYSLLNLAHLQRRNEKCGSAITNYDRAIELYNSMEFSLDTYDARRGRLICYVETADAAAIENDLPQVLELFEAKRTKILEEQNRNTFFDNEQSVYDLAIDYEFGKGDFEKAFDYSEASRSRSLLDWQKNGAQVSLEEDKPQIVFDEKISKPQKLAALRAQIPEQVNIIQYAVLPNRVLIWLITKNGLQSFSSDVTAKELEDKAARFLEAIQNKDSTGQNEHARELYQILFKPLERSLDGARELCLIPDKILSHLPFAALMSDKTGNFLVADYKMFLSPSANVFIVSSENARKRSHTGREKLLSVGNPLFDRQEFPDLSFLPAAKSEAEAIAEFYYEPQVLLERQATKEKLKSVISQTEIIHFAGHYVTSEQSPLLSSFLVAGVGKDSRLANYELLEQNLQRPKLIVLSACQTGIERYYKGEGMIGAGRIFLASGIPLVVASQWQVDSDATAELMQHFHRYRTQGESTVTALQRAQVELLNGRNEAFRQPFYWAGFMTLGGYAQF